MLAEDLGVNLHLRRPDPVCAVNSGEIIPSHRVKEVLKECVEEKLCLLYTSDAADE